jgi:hypothetical protein
MCIPFRYEEVDAVSYYKVEEQKLKNKIDKALKVENKPSGTGFVLFNSVQDCIEASSKIQDF